MAIAVAVLNWLAAAFFALAAYAMVSLGGRWQAVLLASVALLFLPPLRATLYALTGQHLRLPPSAAALPAIGPSSSSAITMVVGMTSPMKEKPTSRKAISTGRLSTPRRVTALSPATPRHSRRPSHQPAEAEASAEPGGKLRGADEADGVQREGDRERRRPQAVMVDVDERGASEEGEEARHAEPADEGESEEARIADQSRQA